MALVLVRPRLCLLSRDVPLINNRKALLLKRESRREEAIEALILSIGKYPWNWSAWVLLGTCISDRDEVSVFFLSLSFLDTYTVTVCGASPAPPSTPNTPTRQDVSIENSHRPSPTRLKRFGYR